MTDRRYRGLIVLDDWAFERAYGPDIAAEIGRLVELLAPPMQRAELANRPDLLEGVELFFGGWGMPFLDGALLAKMPNLRAVFLAAGSVRGVVGEDFWRRNIPIVSAYEMNAIPVAEFAFAEIIFSLKHGWRYVSAMQRTQRYCPKDTQIPGAFGTTVGLVSLGAIGRRVAALLSNLEVSIIAYDPYCPPAVAAELGLSLVSLAEVFDRSHVVSLHTPWLPATEGMITGELVGRLHTGATLINTARGALVREGELVEVLTRRPDLTAVLDVTWPEPPAADSGLLRLPNVMLTPHIAGSMDLECRRLGRLVLNELDRFLRHQPMQWVITQEKAALLA